jgi:hypothetical protein
MMGNRCLLVWMLLVVVADGEPLWLKALVALTAWAVADLYDWHERRLQRGKVGA